MVVKLSYKRSITDQISSVHKLKLWLLPKLKC